ncbi:hypothetical protein INT48_003232 [Thamnidium elegans]|uniref:VWFA domain-containing protein n=1 Tax=Thamnidium elegans TaxID=101142 RepID=A0A8H7SYA2_9FUNG|nr:hypothetical protein INT48_003232 [Thamnidium elegans]
MSFINYPSALPYFESLHKEDLLLDLVKKLGNEQQVAGDIASLKIEDDKEKEDSHPFMDAFDKVANLTRTTNGALTNATTEDFCLDLYYGIQSVQPSSRDALLKASWNQDPLLTVHIIFYTRSIPRGKSLLDPFLTSYCWLLLNHPQTAIKNLHMLIDGTVRTDAQLQANKRKEKKLSEAKQDGWEVLSDADDSEELLIRRDFKTHGCWKDLNSLLTIYCQGEVKGREDHSEYKALIWPRHERQKSARIVSRREQNVRYFLRKSMDKEDAKKNAEECHEKNLKRNEIKKEEARKERLETRERRNKTVCDLLENDETYRALHFTIANMYADQLKTDMAQVEKNKVSIAEKKMMNGRHALGFNLSLAAKWAPSLCLSHDKHTFLATSISELLFPPHQYQETDETRTHYLNKVRELYRKKYLVPLREAMDITEHYKAAGKWDKVDFRHMPSVCLEKSMPLFFKHAPDTVIEYMDEVSKGKKKVSGAALAPNELVHKALSGGVPKKLGEVISRVPGLLEKFVSTQTNMVNGQWNTLIESIRNTSLLASGGKDDGKKKRIDLGECIAICDVSGSMMGGSDDPEMSPYNAAIGLSLIVTNLAKPPFNGAIITFTDNPYVLKVNTSDTFTEQVNTVTASEAGFNTDICKVFTEVLLPMAKKHNLAPQDMVKRLFVFTDMEFDENENSMEEFSTTQDFIRKQYNEAGYEMPELVWWNLCSGSSYMSEKKMNAPTTKDEEGTTLLSGFSASMIKTFLDGEVGDDDDGDEEEKEGVDGKVTKKKLDNPDDFMKKAVCHESFSGLVVLD